VPPSVHGEYPGWWLPAPDRVESPPLTGEPEILRGLLRVREPVALVALEGGHGPARLGLCHGGILQLGAPEAGPASQGEGPGSGPRGYPLLAHAAAQPPEHLGDPAFCAAHGLRYPYVVGAMANGISSVETVEAAARAGLLAFFGSAGLTLRSIKAAIDRLQPVAEDLPVGFNLIHSPAEPQLERDTVALYLHRRINLISAAAYMELTLPLVRYRVRGIFRDGSGAVVAPNRIIAKVSRMEVARRFLSPPPEALLRQLVSQGEITPEQAQLAASIPMAEDLTAEADSAGHTDNQPALTLLPTLVALRDELQATHRYPQPPRIGAAGGLGTPTAVAAALALGAAYVLTGSINQACVQSGTSPRVRRMLAEARQADVAMAPAADMFEMGAQVQVLKRGTMFPMRARKLYELYRAHDSLEAIPARERTLLERDYLHATLEQAWASTREYFLERDPAQVSRAQQDPRHRMALVFRSYLGRSSDWANQGDPARVIDYQIWCGPAMGAFNEWTRGTFLEDPDRRCVVTVALNLLVGAAVLTRVHQLRSQLAPHPEFSLPAGADQFIPLELPELSALLQSEVLA
jgi:trans-AT polyketide synthase/acyltransferase/oxidoreductase domain-containing protein